MNNWLSLVVSLPTENTAVRMKAWRALKVSGAIALRDGIYLMPNSSSCEETLESIADEVRTGGGTALVLHIAESKDIHFPDLFDRQQDYAAFIAEATRIQNALSFDTVQDARKQTRKLQKTLTNLIGIDFFPQETQKQAIKVLQNLELAIARAISPNEPHSVIGSISRAAIGEHQHRTWATRHRPWVDRLASAWLIQRFIDPQANFIWLKTPDACPMDALGFDFDGARFSHVDGLVTYEVLLASFGLESPALARIGSLVHYLDVGGVQPPEAKGIESILSGLRDTIKDDDDLLKIASTLFDGLLVTFQQEKNISSRNPNYVLLHSIA
jgi:hypothetical protein